MSSNSPSRPFPRALVPAVALLAVLAVAGPAPVAAAPPQIQEPSGDEILDEVEQRYESADSVAGRAVVTATNDTATDDAATVTSNVSFAVADPDSSWFVVERAGETYRTGSNGTVAWSVGPDGAAVWEAGTFGESLVEQLPGTTDAVALAVPTDLNATDRNVELVGQTEVDGTPAYELRLGPTDDGESVGDGDGESVRLFVATEDSRVLRAVRTDGATRTTVDVREVEFDAAIHESTFRPPTDRVDAASFDRYGSFADTQDATEMTVPRLEDGTFRDATVAVQDGETVAAQRYDLDGENVTVVSTTATDRFDRLTENASTVQLDGREATVASADGQSIVVWTEGNVTTAVVVEGTTDRAVEIAGML